MHMTVKHLSVLLLLLLDVVAIMHAMQGCECMLMRVQMLMQTGVFAFQDTDASLRSGGKSNWVSMHATHMVPHRRSPVLQIPARCACRGATQSWQPRLCRQLCSRRLCCCAAMTPLPMRTLTYARCSANAKTDSCLLLCKCAADAGDTALMPTANLSNKLNPNNIHYDRDAAVQYKGLSKADKETLWAHDRGRYDPLSGVPPLGMPSPGYGAAEHLLAHHANLERPLNSTGIPDSMLAGLPGTLPMLHVASAGLLWYDLVTSLAAAVRLAGLTL